MINKLPTLALLAGLATLPGLAAAESPASADVAADAQAALPASPATIAYGPPVVYYGGDWERPSGTAQRRHTELRQYAQARARAAQTELASAQWQDADRGER